MTRSAPGPVAYLTGEYPRATDTFILREVAGLRAAGETIATCSIRRTDPSHHVGDEQRAEAARTFAVLEAAKSPLKLLEGHLRLLVGAPARYLSTLVLALRVAPPGLKGLVYQLIYFAEAGVLARHLSAVDARRLHNHFGDSSCTVAMLAATLADLPFSVTIHGPGEFFAAEKWRLDEKFARADFVACISHFCRSQCMLFCDPKHWDKLRIVHCGVDPALYDRPRETDPGAPRLLFVGRLAAVKGVRVLFDAFRRLRETRPTAVLTLVGDGPDRAALEQEARSAGLGEAVVFAGYQTQTQVAEHLARSDVFVLPSFAEGLPVVLMEALASRTPAVATRIAGVAELIADGKTGVLVPPGDVESLTAALDRLLSDPDARTRLGEAGRARVVEGFDSSRESARLADLLAGRPVENAR